MVNTKVPLDGLNHILFNWSKLYVRAHVSLLVWRSEDSFSYHSAGVICFAFVSFCFYVCMFINTHTIYTFTRVCMCVYYMSICSHVCDVSAHVYTGACVCRSWGFQKLPFGCFPLLLSTVFSEGGSVTECRVHSPTCFLGLCHYLPCSGITTELPCLLCM